MYDYCPDAHVYVYLPGPGERPDGTAGVAPGSAHRMRVSDLLPAKTRRRW
jgi:cytidine deaminase